MCMRVLCSYLSSITSELKTKTESVQRLQENEVFKRPRIEQITLDFYIITIVCISICDFGTCTC